MSAGPVKAGPDAICIDRNPFARCSVFKDAVTVMPGPAADPMALGGFVVGAILAAVCRQRGWYSFDGTAIARDPESAILILGLPGAGKSTLAAALNRPIWGDGVLGVGMSPRPVLRMPGRVPLRLWAGGLAALQWPEPSEKPLREPWRRWSVSDRAAMVPNPPSLVAIRGLVFAQRGPFSSDPVSISPGTAAAWLGAVQWNFGVFADADALSTCAELAKSVPAVTIQVGDGATQLNMAARAVGCWIKELAP